MGYPAKPPPQDFTGIALLALILGILSIGVGALAAIPATALGVFALHGHFRRSVQLHPLALRQACLGVVLGCVGIALTFVYGWVIARHVSAAFNYRRSVNNMAHIGEAIHQFSGDDIFSALPAAGNPDKESGLGLSWRVHILPFLGEQELYRQFNLNEPWDSEHNLRLVERMPAVFRSAKCDEDFKTLFLGVSGPDSMFNGVEATIWRDVIDGTANTLMVVEVNPRRAVVWTKPADWQYDAHEPCAGLGEVHSDGFLGLFGNGSVYFVENIIATRVMSDICIKDDWQPNVVKGAIILGWTRFAKQES